MKRFAIAGLVLVPLLAGAFVVQDRAALDGGRLFGQVLDLVESRYVDSVDAAILYEKAARGLVAQLQDPYSELFSPKQLTQFNTTTAGRYAGLGMQIEEQPGKGVVVSKVFPNTPAEGAGAREGDMIIAIDTVSTRGWSSARVADSLRGTPGSKVSVSFARPGVNEPITSSFTRAVIRIPAVPYAIHFDKVGYVPLQGFNETATQEVATAVRRLQQEGAKGLILDLRGNGGGFLDQSLAISNLFLPKGTELASVRGRNQEVQTYTARENPIVPNLPIVILTDQFTASASEIVAGALQDHDRALILGTTSFGKGLVQTLFNLDGGYALKITTGKWYTPSGRTIQKERRLTGDGQFVEVHPDSLESDSARKARPTYKSDAGRVVYGGGAITPDVIVKPDTFTAAEQAFLKATASKSQDIYVVTYDFAMELRERVKGNPQFTVVPTWRDELYNRLVKKGVQVDRKLFDGAQSQIDRMLGQRVARLAFGDSTARRRSLDDDIQLQKALEILKKGQSQKDLFALAPQFSQH
jgi:carboxyl-terminal processing protease